jgi:3-phenylpropionate/trans-cinnamate dioxygenase ferredoxin reductase subunit
LAARTLPGQPAGVHTLRTLDDALTLRAALERAGSLLVVGGGFIGAEVASSARTLGLAVTVLEALPVPSARALGEELGALTGRLMTEAGVDLRTDVRIEGFVTSNADGASDSGAGDGIGVSGNGAGDGGTGAGAGAGDGGGQLGVALVDGSRVTADVVVLGSAACRGSGGWRARGKRAPYPAGCPAGRPGGSTVCAACGR